jgi:hypothetical protein
MHRTTQKTTNDQLHLYGTAIKRIRGHYVELVQKLSGRTLTVCQIGRFLNIDIPVIVSVIQENILGTILLLCYINDLFTMPQCGSLYLLYVVIRGEIKLSYQH